MAEIMLAPGRDDFLTTKGLLETRGSRIFGVKVLTNDSYLMHEGAEQQRYGSVGCVLKRFGAARIMVDSKTSNDTPYEMKDVTASTLAGYSSKKTRNLAFQKPDFLTVNFTAPRASLVVFRETTSKIGVEPVCFTTSSRYEEEDYGDLGSSSLEFTKRSTEAVSELGYKAVLAAACDAELIKEINPELFVFGTGGLLYHDEPTTHVRTALYEESRDFVDVYVEGGAILHASDVDLAFDQRFSETS